VDETTLAENESLKAKLTMLEKVCQGSNTKIQELNSKTAKFDKMVRDGTCDKEGNLLCLPFSDLPLTSQNQTPQMKDAGMNQMAAYNKSNASM
jgi:hypothetical protein